MVDARRFVLAALVLTACGSETQAQPEARSGASTDGLVGRPAPGFSVSAISNATGRVSLASLRGKVVIVDFWGTYCEPCKKSFPRLQDLNTKYAASGLQIVGISEDEAENKASIPTFADTYGAKFPLAWDEDKSIAGSYKPETMPSSFIIDKKGVVRFVHVGYHDGEEAEIESEVKGLLGQ